MQDVEGHMAASAAGSAAVAASRPSPSAEQVVAQQAAIAEIGQRALGEGSLDELLSEACALVSRVLDADLASVAALAADETKLTVVAGVGWRPGLVGTLTFGTGTESQAGLTLVAGEPVVVDDYETETRFRISASLPEHEARSGMSVRIGGADAPYGTLSVFKRRVAGFSIDDANFLHAVANVLGAAVSRHRVEQELRTSRDQLAAIVSTIDEGITVRSSDGLIFANDEAARLSGYGSAQELLNHSSDVLDNYEIFDESGKRLSTDELPGRRAMRGATRTEALLGFRSNVTGETHWSVVRAAPVRDENGQVSHVINTFRDVTDERWQRLSREYLADAVAVLSGTLDTADAAQRLADLSVPRLADYCTVSMLEPDGTISLVALAHANPERLETVRRLQKMLPPTDPSAPSGAGRVIREGIVESGVVTPELVDAARITDQQRVLLRELELRAFVTVPLTGRTRPIGALSLVMAESGRTLGSREIALAEELGARAGIALENARLFQSADARRAELDTVLAALAEGVLVFDESEVLRMSNQAAARILGGELPATLTHLWERVGVDARATLADTGATESGALEVQLDQRARWLELRRYRPTTSAPPDTTADGSAPTVVVLRDITEDRAARAARDAFMGVLSHELRTPITTIYGGSQLLERGLDEQGRAEVLADIRAESERLARLVEDLLVMTRVERGIVELADEPILLQHLLAAVIRSSSSRWPGARITLRAADRLPAVRGDATYIEQVVRNLLTNAVRYGDGLSKGIDVMAEETPDSVVVRVLDTGNGFGGEDPERLFELFYRTASARAVPGGAGIGLFVCRTLIEKMGGNIWARERAEGGAEFGFSLPVLESDLVA